MEVPWLQEVSYSEPDFLSVLRPVGISLNNGNFPSLNFNPLYNIIVLKGRYVIGVLPTGFGPTPNPG